MAMLGSLTFSAYATGEENVTPHAKKTFDQEFPGASNANWKKVEQSDLYMVRFVYNQQVLLSYINEEGALLATARNISSENLPFMVNESIAKRFANYRVVQIEEITTATATNYFLTVENARVRIYVKVTSSGTFSQVKKEKIRNKGV